MIEIIIRLLLLLLALFIGEEQTVPLPPTSEAPLMRSMTVIENVEVLVLESYPMQLHLNVTGYQPDGCDFPVQVQQRREGNAVFVEIFRLMPPDTVCPMMIVSYSDTVRLEGGFESGVYTIQVNDFTVEITL